MDNKMDTTYYGILGLYWDNGNKMETTIVYRVFAGRMDNKMKPTIVHWGYIARIDNKKGNLL